MSPCSFGWSKDMRSRVTSPFLWLRQLRHSHLSAVGIDPLDQGNLAGISSKSNKGKTKLEVSGTLERVKKRTVLVTHFRILRNLHWFGISKSSPLVH